MSFARTVVRRPVSMLMVFVVLTGLGIFGLSRIPVDFFPEFELPIIVVTTQYEGAGPQEVETNVTRVLESSLSSVSGIEEMTSTSAEGSGTVILEFVWGTDLAEATNDIRDQLEIVTALLPDEAEDPRILKFDPSSQPIIDIAVRGDLPLEELRDIADDVVRPRFERVEGVGEASVQGGQERQVRVEVIQNRLQALGVTISQIEQALRVQNQQVGGGEIQEGERNLLLRTSGEFESLEEIRNTVIAFGAPSQSRGRTSQLARPILLRDVAEVEFGLSEVDQLAFVNGEPGVYLAIRKESGTNSVQVADGIKAELERINETLPAGVELEVVDDTTTIVRSALNEVGSSMLIGLGFATLVLFLFLRNGRTTLIVAISVPVSFSITLAAMYFAGRSLNVVSLSGLVMALGLIVDASIVIIENIHKHRSEGLDRENAAILGTQEMVAAITASSLTTISVFLPIILLRGELDVIGVMFGEIAFTIVFAISSSLLVAIFLVPVLASTYVPLRSPEKLNQRNKLIRSFDRTMARFFSWLDGIYARALRGVMSARATTLFVAFAILVVSLLLLVQLDVIFAPQTEEDSITIEFELPVGTRIEVTEVALRRLGTMISQEFDELQTVLVTVGSGGAGGPAGGIATSSEHIGDVTVNLLPLEERTMSVSEIEDFVREHADLFPGVQISFSESQGGALSGSDPIDIAVISDDLDQASDTAYAIQRLILDRFPEVTEPTLSVTDALPELEIVIDRERAYAFGLSVADIAGEIRANVQGTTATQYRSGGDEIDVFVTLREEDRSDVPDLEKIFLTSSTGDVVPVSNFAALQRRSGPVAIERENEQRVVHVTGGILPGHTPAEVQSQVRVEIENQIVLSDGVRLDFSGEQAVIEETSSAFLAVLIIAIVLVFAVMAGQFESFKSPFIIIFTIPLMVIGAIGIYFIMGQPFSMFSFMGLIMLAGIVVNDGIVLVDYTNLLRVRGYEIIEACIEGGRSRLQPVLVTTLTTALGMTPLAFFPGEAAVATQPVALTIVGGIISSSLLTLFVVPVLYSLLANKNRVRKVDPAAQLRLAEQPE